MPLRVLCLDIEGAHGGSSHSLHQLLRNADRARVSPEVICRRGGKVEEWYRLLGVPCRVEPDLPKASSLPRLSRNILQYAAVARDFVRTRDLVRALAEEIDARFDVVHFNHEGWFLLARSLRRRTRAAFVMHIRTRPVDTVFARWQMRVIGRTVDHLVFITDNERQWFATLGGRAPGKVVFNSAAPLAPDVAPLAGIPADRFVVACLSNFSRTRGVDRLLEVAEALHQVGERRVLFLVAGDMHLSRSLPGELGEVARAGGTFADVVARHPALSDSFLFVGHTDQPERVLASCHVVAKPTREANPWGRDIIEALAAGRPVFTVGKWQTFVTHAETGFIDPAFDARAWARALSELAGNPSEYRRMAEAARARAKALCDGPSCAADVVQVWVDAAEARRSRERARGL